MTGKRGKPHHAGTYGRDAAQVRAWGYATPDYRCPRCGLTLTEGIQRWGKAGEWDSGHRINGEVGGVMRPEHVHCNRSAGASHGNRLREPHSEAWYR